MSDLISKEQTIQEIEGLISAFKSQIDYYRTSKYKEAQLRIDFINPLLKALGWGVDNKIGKSQIYRDVVQEESIDVENAGSTTKKSPDYTLRIEGSRKLFIEAKQVSINIEKSKEAAFQTKRYGWSANLGISILTNFETLVVYDCRDKPSLEDAPTVSRHKVFYFEEYISRFDELIELLGFESINSGYIDKYFALSEQDTTPFDSYFLSQIESWRKSLATSIQESNQNNNQIDEESINFLVQRLLNRIIFLRICEDREIEKYETLKEISNYDELKTIFRESDKKYNSGLFDFIEDNLSLNINLNEETLLNIFRELYYPISPYDFSVVDPLILSQIYEQYLGSRIAISDVLEVSIIQEPEVVEYGVVPTPKLVAKQIVSETLEKLLNDKSLEQIKELKIADICCGSGTFLIALYDYLIKEHTNLLIENGITNLSLSEKREILTENIFGVDINPYAVEVTRFSLLLRLLEHENAATVADYLQTHKVKVLPNLSENIKCGNSLVDDHFYDYDESAIDNNDLLYKIKPFNWEDEFSFFRDKQGFDAIIGNPPYVRIQNLVKYFKEEIDYYRSSESPYSVSKKDNFDKYYLFVERAITLINPHGVVGYIVPHKFFIVKGGKKLRASITNQCGIVKIIHFGTTQVFPKRQTYTAIVVITKQKGGELIFKRVSELRNESSFDNISTIKYNQNKYSDTPWIFLTQEAEALFNRVKTQNTTTLNEIADIPVGLQTSADNIYILHPTTEDTNTVTIDDNGNTWEIEKEILLPCLYDVRLDLFDTPIANSYIIFPYRIDEDQALIYSEQEMSQQFPLCWKYLSHHKTKLSARSFNDSRNIQWYQYGRSQSLTRFHNTDKLIWKVLSQEASYTYDNSNLQFTGGGNGPYYSLVSKGEYSLFYILAILSHPLIEAIVKSGASEFRGDFYSHGKQFIENIPIRVIDFSSNDDLTIYNKLIKETKEIIKTRKDIQTTNISSKQSVLERKYTRLRKSQIDAINLLYNISSEEVLSVQGDKLFFAELDKEDQD